MRACLRSCNEPLRRFVLRRGTFVKRSLRSMLRSCRFRILVLRFRFYARRRGQKLASFRSFYRTLCRRQRSFRARCQPHIFVAAIAMSLDASLVFYRKEGRPAASIFRLFGISALAGVLVTAAWLFFTGGII